MAKKWWFPFDFRVWRTDSRLRRCSLETRGFWLECLCAMHEEGAFEITGTLEEVGWLIGCAPEVVARCAAELQRTKAADVTLGNGNVTLLSRRLQRDLNDREQTRLRVRKHRSNTDVTIHNNSNSKNKKKKEYMSQATNTHTAADWGFPMQPLIDAFPNVEFTPAMAGFIEGRVTPADAEAWSKTIEIYRMNYDPLKRQYLPTKTANLLSVFDSQKTELEKKKNGATYNTKPSALDTIRSYEHIINEFPTEAELFSRTDGGDAERFN